MDRDVASSCQKEILHRGFKLCKRNGVESGTLVKFSMGNARITFHTAMLVFYEGMTGLEVTISFSVAPFDGWDPPPRINTRLIVRLKISILP